MIELTNISEKDAKPYNVPVDFELAPTTHYANEARFLEEHGCVVTGASVVTTFNSTIGDVH